MTTFRRTPVLDRLLREAREIGGRYEVIWELSQESVTKAWTLRNAGRDFFSVTTAMRLAVTQAQLQAFRRGGLTSILDAAPEAIRAHVLRRFDQGGFDVRIRPDSPAWVAWKTRHQFDPRVGIMTRALRDEVARARVYLRKVA